MRTFKVYFRNKNGKIDNCYHEATDSRQLAVKLTFDLGVNWVRILPMRDARK